MTEQERPNQFVIPVTWHDMNTAAVPTVYANQLLVTHGGGECYLIFGEIVPPLYEPGVPLPETLQPRIVARIAVTREQMVNFARAINQNLERMLVQNDDGEVEK